MHTPCPVLAESKTGRQVWKGCDGGGGGGVKGAWTNDSRRVQSIKGWLMNWVKPNSPAPSWKSDKVIINCLNLTSGSFCFPKMMVRRHGLLRDFTFYNLWNCACQAYISPPHPSTPPHPPKPHFPQFWPLSVSPWRQLSIKLHHYQTKLMLGRGGVGMRGNVCVCVWGGGNTCKVDTISSRKGDGREGVGGSSDFDFVSEPAKEFRPLPSIISPSPSRPLFPSAYTYL